MIDDIPYKAEHDRGSLTVYDVFYWVLDHSNGELEKLCLYSGKGFIYQCVRTIYKMVKNTECCLLDAYDCVFISLKTGLLSRFMVLYRLNRLEWQQIIALSREYVSLLKDFSNNYSAVREHYLL